MTGFSEICPGPIENYEFLRLKITKLIFFNFFIPKSYNFISNLNDDFHEASFEVYYISLSKKLAILQFSPIFFFILTSVTSVTSWGQTISLNDLTKVSKFSWKWQLSYEVLRYMSLNENWGHQRPLSENGTLWSPPPP